MSDIDKPQGIAATGSGKSEAEVAFELLNKLKGQGVWGERNIAGILDMYAECLDAAKGLRAYEGQNRVATPVKTGASLRPQVPTQAAVPQVQPAAAPRQAAPLQAPQAQPSQSQVHAQQQAIAQAYKQG